MCVFEHFANKLIIIDNYSRKISLKSQTVAQHKHIPNCLENEWQIISSASSLLSLLRRCFKKIPSLLRNKIEIRQRRKQKECVHVKFYFSSLLIYWNNHLDILRIMLLLFSHLKWYGPIAPMHVFKYSIYLWQRSSVHRKKFFFLVISFDGLCEHSNSK